ncbi:MAG: S-adenosylmethionine:tRNA ribosyltransferase-isomerase [Bacteroidia bacterium]|nr:S-adenosylmethionine:tRNA ribosyltransferase-isomerase [Bacteroidia bacterium]
MHDPRNIATSVFSYDLPDERIAKFPLTERNQSKLLVYKNGEISHNNFSQLSDYIPESSLLVFNNTKVIHARIEFNKSTGARIEIFCLEPHYPAEYAVAFAQTNKCQWKCMVGNLKKWKSEILTKDISYKSKIIRIQAKLIESEQSSHIIEFEWTNNISFAELIEICGEIPIPPYLNRKPEESDNKRYQTVYSKIDGSVAAPTAGLHFTENEFNSLTKKGINTDYLTLHVGAGTFRPLQSETLGTHKMHTEHFQVSLKLIHNLIKHYPNIIAVGTTSVRTLESLYIIGNLIANEVESIHFTVNQWDAYGINAKTDTMFALKAIENYMITNCIDSINASTSIMIAPGYKFRIISGIITNFHQPKSTLLALVSALVGDNWKKIYSYALKNDFRFLSYGDSSLLIP